MFIDKQRMENFRGALVSRIHGGQGRGGGGGRQGEELIEVFGKVL
jgi:hypothetical protein